MLLYFLYGNAMGKAYGLTYKQPDIPINIIIFYHNNYINIIQIADVYKSQIGEAG